MGISKDAKISDQDSAIAQIYDTLVADLGKGQEATRGIFASGAADMGSAYQSSADQLTQAGQGLGARLGSRLNELGLGAALPDATQGITDNLAFRQGQIAKDRADNLGSLSKQGTQYQAIGQLGIDNTHREKAQRRTTAMESLQAVLAKLEAEEIKARAQVEAARLEGELGLAKMRADVRASSAASRAASQKSIDPLDALKAQLLGLDIQDKELTIAEKRGGPKAPVPTKGMGAVSAFLNSPQLYWNRSADAKTRASFNSVLEHASKFATDPDRLVQGLSDDPEVWAYRNINSVRPGVNREAIRQALDLYYGRQG